jgi:CheY-like chemotaxis protein
MNAAVKMPPVQKISVILADDHPVVRDGLAAIVNQQPDMQVVAEAGDGVEALDLYEKHKPDVMVLDLRMPKMDGAAVVQKANGDGRGCWAQRPGRAARAGGCDTHAAHGDHGHAR